jgi:hypothetical protein
MRRRIMNLGGWGLGGMRKTDEGSRSKQQLPARNVFQKSGVLKLMRSQI